MLFDNEGLFGRFTRRPGRGEAAWRRLAAGRTAAILGEAPCAPPDHPWPRFTHSASITELRDGRLGAVWYGGDHEGDGDVRIWFSRYAGRAWETPRDVSGEGFCDNAVLFQPRIRKDAPLLLYYTRLDARIRRVRTSLDSGETWSEAATLPEEPRLPTGRFMGPETGAPVERPDGSLLLGAAARGEWCGLSSDDGCFWLERTVNGIDDMTLWSPLVRHGHQPAFLIHSEDCGRLQMIGRQGRSFWSEDGGRTWSRVEVHGLRSEARGDVVALHDGRFLAVTTHSRRSRLAVSLSSDGSRWREVLTGPCRGRGYPTVVQAADGRIHILFSDDPIRHLILDAAVLCSASVE